MKMVDEKGRLFGKINAIDFLIILLVLSLAPMSYLGYKIATRKPEVVEAPEREFVEINTDCKFIKLKSEVLGAIAVGNKELDENGDTIGEIINLGQSEFYKYEFDIGEGQKIAQEDRNLRQIEVLLKLKAEVKKGKLYYKDDVIKIGAPLEFKTNNSILTVVPFKLEEEKASPKKKWLSVHVKFSDVPPELANIIKKGDMARSPFGEIEAKVQSVISNEPALVTTIYEGEFITVAHPFQREIVAHLDMLCVEKEGAYYFKDYLAKIGNNIVFTTDLYSISGMTVGIEAK